MQALADDPIGSLHRGGDLISYDPAAAHDLRQRLDRNVLTQVVGRHQPVEAAADIDAPGAYRIAGHRGVHRHAVVGGELTIVVFDAIKQAVQVFGNGFGGGLIQFQLAQNGPGHLELHVLIIECGVLVALAVRLLSALGQIEVQARQVMLLGGIEILLGLIVRVFVVRVFVVRVFVLVAVLQIAQSGVEDHVVLILFKILGHDPDQAHGIALHVYADHRGGVLRKALDRATHGQALDHHIVGAVGLALLDLPVESLLQISHQHIQKLLDGLYILVQVGKRIAGGHDVHVAIRPVALSVVLSFLEVLAQVEGQAVILVLFQPVPQFFDLVVVIVITDAVAVAARQAAQHHHQRQDQGQKPPKISFSHDFFLLL